MAENSPQPQEQQQNQYRNRILAGGIALLASAGAFAAQAEAEPAHLNPSTAPLTLAGGHAPDLIKATAKHNTDPNNISAEIKSFMRENTLYLKELGGCSGQAIRNKEGTIIGALTAEHCSLNSPLTRKEVNGRSYIVQPKPVIMRTGPTRGKLEREGVINRWILPKTSDATHDLAIGVKKGHTAEEVLDAYKATALSPSQIAKLQPGEDVYMSGWPVYRPSHLGGTNPQESFKMSFVNKGQSFSTSGKTLNVAWASVPRNKDGSVCSFGASGSEGFVYSHGKVSSLGTLSVFNDLKLTVPGISNAHVPTAEELKETDVAALCGFNFELPTADTHDVVKVVRAEKDIPGYVSPEAVAKYGTEQMKDPTVTKTVIDGFVSFAPLTDGNAPPVQPFTIEDPILVHDKKHKMTILGTANQKAGDAPFVYIIKDEAIGGISPYSTATSEPTVHVETFGLVPNPDDKGSQLLGSNGKTYGKVYSKAPQEVTGSSELVLENDTYVIRPYRGMK